jgi:hypothetical protein
MPKTNRKFLMSRYLTVNDADEAFYKSYDALFLARKVELLYAMYRNAGSFLDGVQTWNRAVTSSEEQLRSFLATELHCTVFHQTEALIALLLAEYQDKPDWVYLTTYGNPEIKKAAEAIAKHEQIPGTTAVNMADLVKTAVFATWDLSKSEGIREQWNETISSTIALLQIVSEQFIDAQEYNSYKHGLRVVLGSASFGVASGKLAEHNFVTFASMPHAMTFLEKETVGQDDGAKMVSKETKPEYSFDAVTCMANLVSTIKSFRLARIYNKLPEEVSLPMFDTLHLDRIKPVTKVGLSY